MDDSPAERGARRSFAVLDATAPGDPGRRGTSGLAVLVLTAAGAVVASNQHFAELFGVPARVIAARSLQAMVTWLEQEGDSAGVRIAQVLELDVAEEEGEVSSGDGRVIAWTRARLAGEEPGFIYAFREIGRDRAAARSLRDAENWLHMFAAHTGGAVLELDSGGRIVGTWSANAEILSLPESSLQGRTVWEAVGGTQAPELEKVLRAVIASGEEARFECVVDVPGERKVFAMDLSLLPSEASRPAIVSVLVRDITEQTRMQTQLVQAERLASVGLLAAGVAHEINNPLTYMAINFQRVRRGIRTLGERSSNAEDIELAFELEQCIDMVIDGAQRVREIVRDLQSFSRTDRGEIREPVDVRSVLELTLGLVSFELERHARVVRELGPVPLVLASQGRLSQIFLNLIRNAVQALPGPDPSRHEIRLVTSTDARGHAVVEVRDTGSGISSADMRKIFDPFFTTKPATVGTGLGLAICHGITRSFGGEISAESKLGEGTVFRVVLPPAPPPPPSVVPGDPDQS